MHMCVNFILECCYIGHDILSLGCNVVSSPIFGQLHAIDSSPGHSQILSHSCGENWEKAWDQNYVTDQKWWTRLVCNVDSVSQ